MQRRVEWIAGSWLMIFIACGDAGQVGDGSETSESTENGESTETESGGSTETGEPPCDSPWVAGASEWIESAAAQPDHFDPTAPVRLSADGRVIAFGSADPDVAKLETGQVLEIHELDCGEVVRLEGIEVMALALSADGSTIAFVEPTQRWTDPDQPATDRLHAYDRSTGALERIDVDPEGAADETSRAFLGSLSANGRFVAFASSSALLVPEDGDTAIDVFVRDRLTGTTELISISPAGTKLQGESNAPTISDDGRFVAFHAYDPDLGLGGVQNVLVRDREAGTTELLYPPVPLDTANRAGLYPDISGDGRHVVFESEYPHLAEDGDQDWDVYAVDRVTRGIELISVEGPSSLSMHHYLGRISDDGRKIAFATGGAAHDVLYVAVRDRDAGTTTRLDLPLSGPASGAKSRSVDISGEGTWAAFLNSSRVIIDPPPPPESGLNVYMTRL